MGNPVASFTEVSHKLHQFLKIKKYQQALYE